MKIKSFLMFLLLMFLGVVFVACKQEVTPSLTVDSELTTIVGEKVTLTPTIGGTEEELVVVYESDKPTVASVNEDGIVSALAAGTAKITVSLEVNPEIQAIVTVRVVNKVTVSDFAPTTIKLSGNATVALGQTHKLTTEIIPATANKELIWDSSDAAIASVASDGTVTAHKFGQVTITAKSAFNGEVKATHTIKVVQEGADSEVINDAVNQILAQIPEFVSASFDLPTHKNPDVSVTWANSSGQELTRFEFNATADGTSLVVLKVEYKFEQVEKNVVLKLVVDPNNNNHKKLDDAAAALAGYFAVVSNEITSDLMFPTSLKGVAVTWSSSKANVISNAGKFVRPDNNTPVNLTATLNSGGLNKVVTFPVVGVGYTTEQKLDYVKTKGSLKDLVNASIFSSVSLPLEDTKFGIKFTWTSGNQEVITNEGRYVSSELAEAVDVVFTVVAEYDVQGFAFEEEFEITIKVNPMNEVGKAVFAFQESEFEYPKQVAYGIAPTAPGQLTDLPTSIDGFDVTITWFGKEGEFDTEMNVVTQRLLYTPTVFYARFSKEGLQDVVLEFPINIGILPDEDAFAFTARSTKYSGLNHPRTDGMPAADKGTGTVYALGLESFYFKSRFGITVGEEVIEKDFYYFFAIGNYKEWTEDAVTVDGDKRYIDPSKEIEIEDPEDSTKTIKVKPAVLAPQWSSTNRVWKNTTEAEVVVKVSQVVALGGQGNTEAYKVFVIDKDGIITTANVAMSEVGAEVVVPVGGMLINTGYLEVNSQNFIGFGKDLGRKIDVLPLVVKK